MGWQMSGESHEHFTEISDRLSGQHVTEVGMYQSRMSHGKRREARSASQPTFPGNRAITGGVACAFFGHR